MIELFTHKHIRCEYCEFEISFMGFGSAAMIVCPACGGENALSLPHQEPVQPEPVASPTAASELLPQTVSEKPVSCSIEHCPLLTGKESDNASEVKAIAEQLGLRLDQKKKRRKTILAWTVTLQVCILFGTALFVAKTNLVPKADSAAITVVVADIAEKEPEKPPVFVEVVPPINVVPLLVAPENKTAWNNVPVDALDPFTPFVEPGSVVSAPAMFPHEMVQDIISSSPHDHPPQLDDAPITVPHMLSATSGHEPQTIEAALPLTPLTEPLKIEPLTLDMADDFLDLARATLVTDPESSVEQSIRAAKIYEQHGRKYPDSMYWILGSAFASLSWGDPLLESSPAIETMTLSADNRWLLTQLKNKTVWLLDLQSPAHDRTKYLLDSGTAEYVKFVFSPDLRWIIGGQKNGTVRIWDMWHNNPASATATFAERIPDLQDLQISPNGQWLAAFGSAPHNTILSRNFRPGQLKPGQPIRQVSHQQPASFDISDSSSYPVLLWNLRQMESSGVVPMAMAIPAIPQPVQVIRFSPNSDRIAVGGRDAVVRVYDLTVRGVSGDPFVLRGHHLGITQIAYAPNGQWIATGSQDNTVRLWNLASSKFAPESATLFGHLGWISALAIDTTGEYVFSGSYDRTIRIWNVKHNHIDTALKEEPIVLATNLGVPEALYITQQSDKMVTLGKEGCLGIYHLPSILCGQPAEEIRAIAFRNSKLSISKCLLTSDDQFLIFSYDHLTNPSNNGIRLWALHPQAFVR